MQTVKYYCLNPVFPQERETAILHDTIEDAEREAMERGEECDIYRRTITDDRIRNTYDTID